MDIFWEVKESSYMDESQTMLWYLLSGASPIFFISTDLVSWTLAALHSAVAGPYTTTYDLLPKGEAGKSSQGWDITVYLSSISHLENAFPIFTTPSEADYY